MSTLLKEAFSKATLLTCKGFDPLFIDKKTRLDLEDIIPESAKALLPVVEGNDQRILNYTNLSVLYNSKRRVPFVSAYQVDGNEKIQFVKRANSFKADPRIDAKIQLSQEGFYNLRKDITEFEIGHMAANNEMAWGPAAQLQSYQTFHFPNSVPQAENLNTGIWKTLETYIIDEAATVPGNKRICVFTGPLLKSDDPAYKLDPDFQIPLLFYKVIVFSTIRGLYSTAFIMSHEQRMIDQQMFVERKRAFVRGIAAKPVVPVFDDFKYRKVFQVNIRFLEEQTGLNFTWKGVKSIPVPNDKNQLKKIRKVTDSKEAAGLQQSLRRGVAPVRSAKTDLTPDEIKNKTHLLNIILP